MAAGAQFRAKLRTQSVGFSVEVHNGEQAAMLADMDGGALGERQAIRGQRHRPKRQLMRRRT